MASIPGRWYEGRIEKRQRIPPQTVVEGIPNRRDGRDGMKDPGGRFGAQGDIDTSLHLADIRDEVRHIVVRNIVARIVAVIAKIEEHEIVIIGQPVPERQVSVDRQAVAVGQNETRPSRISMLPYPDNCAITHGEFESMARFWNDPFAQIDVSPITLWTTLTRLRPSLILLIAQTETGIDLIPNSRDCVDSNAAFDFCFQRPVNGAQFTGNRMPTGAVPIAQIRRYDRVEYHKDLGAPMTTDLLYLALTAGLAAILWIPNVAAMVMQHGVVLPADFREAAEKPLQGWGQRAKRVHLNMVENLAHFSVLVIVAHLSGMANEQTAFWAQMFFWARVAHALIFYAGIPYLRTVAFTIGFIAEVGIFIAIIG